MGLAASLSTVFVDEERLDDHGSVLARFEGGTHGSFVVSQVAAGSRNDLRLTVDGQRLRVLLRSRNRPLGAAELVEHAPRSAREGVWVEC